MKKTETFIVFRNKKTGYFLSKYKSKEQTLAYSTEYTEGLKRAAKNEVKAIKIQIEDFAKLANALNCELLEVTATYELKTLDGEEPEESIEGTETSGEEEFKRFLKMLEAGMEDD